jgi:3-phenylpropionate/trans-cinnamate dioxygenase ferredoxin subunit
VIYIKLDTLIKRFIINSPDMHDELHWVKIADSIAALHWQENGMCIVTVEGKTITLARKDNELFAFAHKCPHAGGVMANGYLDAIGNVVCPLHRYRFNMTNGRNTSGEGYYLKTYAIRTTDSAIYIGFKRGLFSF